VALLLAPSGASAAWTVPPTPNPQGSTFATLNAVDCTSANSCMAVGNTSYCNAPPCTINLTGSTAAEHWDGTSWKIVPTPDPISATPIGLNGVSCPWQNFCLAVGASGSGSSLAPLIELWNGTSWSHQPSPAVPGGALYAVSCSGLLACTAIGADATGTLAERWDGTGWHVQPIPDASPPPGGLADVSCPLKRTCTAVGQSNGTTNSVPLAERWFGRVNSWGLEAPPKPSGADSAELSGVSCPDGPVCFAVGSSLSHPTQFTIATATLVERRVGSKWSVMPTPNTPGPPDVGNLFDVSCPGVRACHAVGEGWDVTDHQPIAIGERYDGASWQLETIPNPDSGEDPHLAGVSCPNRLFCMAVGYDSNTAPGAIFETVAAKWTP
jgi:hypothetical protein